MMNERIRELAEQAVQLVADEHTKGDVSRLNTDSYHVKDLINTKFAELIVRECLNQLQELVPPQVINENHQELVNSAHRYALDVSGAKIKKHFGVEE